ncbi:MAG: hypothetical protein ACSHXI_05905 [Hoeflea sp.]|uniref:hypothetical protein n=1 Tax=Hoeflea sp. TaxID=1940281 RepID=UPI003EF2056F
MSAFFTLPVAKTRRNENCGVVIKATEPTEDTSAVFSMGMALLIVAIMWSVSSWGYYALVHALALERGYDQAPMLVSGYYLMWSIAAAAAFWSVLSSRLTLPLVTGHLRTLIPALLIFGTYVAMILPLLPEVSVELAPPNPPEFMFASAWYYLPKSTDILFQQVLISAMVFSAARTKISLPKISLGMAVLFGGFHLLLALEGFTALYVIRFTIAASIFGLFVPYLYLKTRYGFRWAYGLHWSFYAVDATVTHFMLGASI